MNIGVSIRTINHYTSMADIKARKLAFIAGGLFEFSWLAIKDEAENTIRKRNTDAVKTTQFLCVMVAS